MLRLLFLVFCSVIACCSYTLAEDASNAVISNQYSLGFLSPLTEGNYESQCCGQQAAFAFRLAIEHMNEQGVIPGVTLVPIVNDTSSDERKAIFMTLDLIRKFKAIGLVGELRSGITRVVQYIAGEDGVAQISYASTSPALSDKASYPTLSRTIPSDAEQGACLVHFIKTVGWGEVAMIHSTDDYGTGLGKEFNGHALAEGIHISIIRYFSPGQEDVDELLQSVKDSGSRVILLVAGAMDARTVLLQARKMGMTQKGWAWLGTDGWLAMDGPAWNDHGVVIDGHLAQNDFYTDDFIDAMQGAIGTVPIREFRSDRYQEVDAAWRAHEKYEDLPYVEPILGMGQWGAYAYDATLALGLALKHTLDSGIHIELDIRRNMSSAIRHIKFEGVTGTVAFNQTTGDRFGSYAITNVQGRQTIEVGSAQVSPNEAGKIDMDVNLKNVLWPGSTHKIPDDRLSCEDYEIELDDGTCYDMTSIYLVFGIDAVIVECLLVAAVITLYIKRNDPLIKAASAPFCMLVCVGAMGVTSSVILAIIGAECQLRMWVFCVSFALMFGSLFAKTYRIYKVACALVEVRKADGVTNRDVIRIVAFIVVCECGLLAANHVTGALNCDCDDHVIFTTPVEFLMLFLYNFILLSWGGFLAHAVRGMKKFGDAQNVAYAVYCTFVVACLWLPISSFLKDEEVAQFVLNNLAILVVVIFTISVLFLRKLLHVLCLSGGEKNLDISTLDPKFPKRRCSHQSGTDNKARRIYSDTTANKSTSLHNSNSNACGGTNSVTKNHNSGTYSGTYARVRTVEDPDPDEVASTCSSNCPNNNNNSCNDDCNGHWRPTSALGKFMPQTKSLFHLFSHGDGSHSNHMDESNDLTASLLASSAPH